MITLVGTQTLGGIINWQIMNWGLDVDAGITINFPFYQKLNFKKALAHLKEALITNNIDWIQEKNKRWFINLDKLKKEASYAKLDSIPFITGVVEIEADFEEFPEYEYRGASFTKNNGPQTLISFVVTKKEIMENKSRKVFLSHKSADKPLVRNFATTLGMLGLDTWLDEINLTAGVELERGLLQGFKDSCAAIFFITPNYLDEKFLAKEVDYAIAEKNDRGDHFSIITILLHENGKSAQVPDLLKRFVFKEPKSEMEALQEILRALPIKSITTEFQ
jgi:hypothetical protein